MKLHLASAEGNLFTGYGNNYVEINKTQHQGSLIVSNQQIEAWPVANFASLDESHFAMIAAMNPELVLIGTGRTIRQRIS